MKAPRFPVSVRRGSVVTRVYRLKRGDGREIFTAAWNAGGRRLTRQFPNYPSAHAEASLKADQLAAGRVDAAANLSGEDGSTLSEAKRICGSVPLISVLQEWARARDLTQGNVIAAAELWAARHIAKHERIKMKDVVNRFLKEKTATGIQTAENHGDLFRNVKADLGELFIDTVSSQQLTLWLGKRNHPSTRNTYRKHIVSMFRWAQRQGYLPREQRTEAEQTDRASEPPLEIGIIDAEKFAALLVHFEANHPEYLAALVLAGFCGLRRSEVHSQTWADIHLERGHVRVSKAKKGTPSKRIVPLCSAAVGWLMLCKDRQDDVCGNLAMDRIRNIGRDAGFDLPENCFRHSFISHRVAQTGNVAETSLEGGNSPAIIFKHYRELVTKEEGIAWFSVKR